jgi:hypothetical protein
MFLSKLLEEVSSFRGWNHHEFYPSPRHQNDTTYTMLSVTIDTVIHNFMWYTYWNTFFEPRASTKREYCDFSLLKFFVDWLGVDHAIAHCYTGSISSFAVFFGLNPPGNLLINRQWIGNWTESGQGFLMCSHCLNELPLILSPWGGGHHPPRNTLGRCWRWRTLSRFDIRSINMYTIYIDQWVYNEYVSI